MPRISVIFPVYNAERYLDAAVGSVLAQTWRDFELIALDDGSTDGSRAILERIATTDDRIRIVSRPNKGLIGTLNEGLGLARGGLIARMDADDIALPGRFAAQVERLDADPALVALGGQILAIDAAGRALAPLKLPCGHEGIDGHHMTRLDSVIFHPTAMVRTDAVIGVGGYDLTMDAAEDFDLWLRLAEIGRLANLDRCVLHYRQHLASVGHARRHQQRMTAWRAIRNACDRRGLPFDVPCPAEEPPVSHGEVFRKWGWWALGAGHVGTARHYAWRCLRDAPASKETWRLLACALRGR